MSSDSFDLTILEPRGIWKWFDHLRRIPRPSGSEEKVSDFLVQFARERGLVFSRDDVGNVMIRCPGRGDPSGSLPLCLQAHTDMVAEKLDSSSHDFTRDAISVEIDGDWVVARETTLGADNGVGVALMLAILDSPDLPHPPLECLFTIDEERGLTGASHLDPSWLESRRMINLDSEEEGHFCIGCAGGMDTQLAMRVELLKPLSGMKHLAVNVEGLRGGHSGMEINRWRANAIRVLARVLDELQERHGCRVSRISGGSKRNAIPRTASAGVFAPVNEIEGVIRTVSAIQQSQREEFSLIDDDISIQVKPSTPPDAAVMSAGDSRRIIDILLALHHGVEKMSGISPELVETSCNLATLETEGDAIRICLTVRSLLEGAKKSLGARLAATARLSGLHCEINGGYPGWKPNPSSELLATAVEFYRFHSGKEPCIETVHAGLECGIIGDKLGGMDMISMGPDIRDVHAPGEKVGISSTARFWDFFTRLLERL